MENKYLYKVFFRKTNFLIDGYYSTLIERDSPISTEKDKNEIKVMLQEKYRFSKVKCLRYQLIGKNHPEIPF